MERGRFLFYFILFHLSFFSTYVKLATITNLPDLKGGLLFLSHDLPGSLNSQQFLHYDRREKSQFWHLPCHFLTGSPTTLTH